MLTGALLALSALLAIVYGAFGSSLYESAPPYAWPALFKASSIVVLALIAWTAGASPAGAIVGKVERATSGRAGVAGGDALQPPHNKLLATALIFGALGDALLAWSPQTFLHGALAFLIGHLFYITLFLRNGLGIAALKQPPRAVAALALIIAAIVMTAMLVPADTPLFAPLAVYTGVLTLMALCSFTLPATRWLAMAGAVLFFVSDGFVAANMFHPAADPTLGCWRSFIGWMVYWGGQAALCMGALGLAKQSET